MSTFLDRMVPSPVSQLEPQVAQPRSTAKLPDFAAVFAEHLQYLWGSLRRLGIHERDLEDMAHEVFLRVYHQLPQRDPEQAIRPWLFNVALGLAANYRRLARHRIDLNNEAPEAIDQQPAADERLIARERRRLVQAALQQIPLEQRAILILHDMDETPIPEIALALGIGINTAYSRLRLGRDAFRRSIEQVLSRGGSL
ncbi:MAG TPA: sigma-70 family RNA polymerase sigma factor [Polyangiaceae bacterium]